MERVSSLFGKLPTRPLTPEQIALAAWPRAVGKKIAAHARPTKMVRACLIVEVEDSTWQRSLFTLSKHILSNLGRAIGPGLVEEIEFRVVPRRREPARASTAIPSVEADEADAIGDPVLRGLYKSARRRATA